jgi:chromate transporter
VAFATGLIRAGYRGGLAAFAGFTLPSAILMTAFAYGASALSGPVGMGLLHGLKLVAVSIVGHAVYGMARTLCPDRERAAIACMAAVMIVFGNVHLAQMAAIAGGALAGLWLCRSGAPQPAGTLALPVSRPVGAAALFAFLLLLLLPANWGTRSTDIQLFAAFYRSGALVFGGGHVVLPLLSSAFVTPGWVSKDAFLAGYGAAQAIPGPLFTFAAYLGVVAAPSPRGIAGAALGLTGIFLPGTLILLAALPFWDSLRRRVEAQALMRGINAAVVGLLAAALYNPVWTSSVKSPLDFAIALVGFVLLTSCRAPPLVVVILGAAAGIIIT